MGKLVVVALAAALFASCATDHRAAAVQQTSIGGGLVAVGVVGAAGGAVATGVALATGTVRTTQLDDVALPLVGAAVVDAAVIGLGAFLMKSAEDDLVERPPPVVAAPSARVKPRSPRARDSKTPEAEDYVAPTFAAASARLAVAASSRGVLLQWTNLPWDIGSCRRADFSVDGNKTPMILDDDGAYVLAKRGLDLGSTFVVSVDLCGVVVELTAEEKRAITDASTVGR